MADSKKYNGSTWEHSLRKLATATDTFTTLPVDVYADGNNATVGLKGNTVQNGTPTPDSPIMPQGTGDLETSGAKAGQYKIPFSSANTTTPVYLGEVETTRKIGKLVLTGEETMSHDTINNNSRFTIENTYSTNNYRLGGCSHYKYEYENTNNTIYHTSANESQTIFILDNNYITVPDFKTYLADQYAAGTPVCVWYVLATPQTAVVNEPLMRIGDYADTVSGITIPTVTGKDAFDVETTLKPSEVSLSYTGWHDATVGEWDGSQWNE